MSAGSPISGDEKRVRHRESTPGPLTHEARPLSTKPLALHLCLFEKLIRPNYYAVERGHLRNSLELGY